MPLLDSWSNNFWSNFESQNTAIPYFLMFNRYINKCNYLPTGLAFPTRQFDVDLG